MPAWLHEREVFASVFGSLLGTALLIVGELAERESLSDNGTWILSASLLSLGIARGLAKSGSVK